VIEGARPDASPVGIALAVAALVVMPLLVRAKRRIAAEINSAALRGDAACSLSCAAMAVALLAGLGFNAILHWWWAEYLAALAFLYWLLPETWGMLRAAARGEGACSCDDACSG
jgi:divalent metal cation (Fe/Co/Zn/Cd) transporter